MGVTRDKICHSCISNDLFINELDYVRIYSEGEETKENDIQEVVAVLELNYELKGVKKDD